MKVGERKIREDKKIDFKPLVNSKTKTGIYQLAFITETPIKNVAEHLCVTGLHNISIIEEISAHFKRDLHYRNTFFRGDPSTPSLKKRHDSGECQRISFRVKNEINDTISALAYALDCSKARVCAVILEKSMNNFEIVNEYVEVYIEKGLDKERVNELKKLMRSVNGQNNEYKFSWPTLLTAIMNEINPPTKNVKDAVDTFIIHHWKKK